MTHTLRTLAAWYGLGLNILLDLLELDPVHHDVDADLAPRVEQVWRNHLASIGYNPPSGVAADAEARVIDRIKKARSGSLSDAADLVVVEVIDLAGVLDIHGSLPDVARHVARVRRSLDMAERLAVMDARHAGATWEDVALAFGLGSKQAAQQRFSKAVSG